MGGVCLVMGGMDKKIASKIWVELNLGEKPKELNDVPLDTHEQVWAEMEKVRPFASKKEVDRIWNERQGITNSDIGGFGHE